MKKVENYVVGRRYILSDTENGVVIGTYKGVDKDTGMLIFSRPLYFNASRADHHALPAQIVDAMEFSLKGAEQSTQKYAAPRKSRSAEHGLQIFTA